MIDAKATQNGRVQIERPSEMKIRRLLQFHTVRPC
jgi:hypothetical protein